MNFYHDLVNIDPFSSGKPWAERAWRKRGTYLPEREQKVTLSYKTTYMKTVHIVGNRPQFVKLSLLYRAWERRGGAKPIIIHTGQHFSDGMSNVFFQEFQIPAPDHQLNINGYPHAEMIGRMLASLDRVLAAEKPDGIIVYGDTNTTLAGALAAKKRNIPLAHVEAGIRTGKEDMPEESNRYLTDRLAGLNFACTYRGVENLLREGYTAGGGGKSGNNSGAGAGKGGDAAEGQNVGQVSGAGKGGAVQEYGKTSGTGKGGAIASLVYNTGDLMLDAALLFKDRAREQSSLLRQLGLEGKPFILATIHRAENLDHPEALRAILQALYELHPNIPVVFPVHPRTQQLIDQYGLTVQVHTIAPVGYLDMMALVQACQHVITDSGGLSREAFFFGKPSVIVMEQPFWPEILEHGPCLQANADRLDILEKFHALGSSPLPFRTELFGDGHAAEKIADILMASW